LLSRRREVGKVIPKKREEKSDTTMETRRDGTEGARMMKGKQVLIMQTQHGDQWTGHLQGETGLRQVGGGGTFELLRNRGKEGGGMVEFKTTCAGIIGLGVERRKPRALEETVQMIGRGAKKTPYNEKRDGGARITRLPGQFQSTQGSHLGAQEGTQGRQRP